MKLDHVFTGIHFQKQQLLLALTDKYGYESCDNRCFYCERKYFAVVLITVFSATLFIISKQHSVVRVGILIILMIITTIMLTIIMTIQHLHPAFK